MPENLESVPLLSDRGSYSSIENCKTGDKGNNSNLFYETNNGCGKQITLDDKRKAASNKSKYQPLYLWQKTLLFVSSSYLIFITGLGNIYAEMIRTLGVSRTEASLVQSLTRAITYGAGMVSGMLLKHYGNTRCILIGTLLSTTGLVISSVMTNIIIISICTGVVTDKRNIQPQESKQIVPVFDKSLFKNPYFLVLIPATAFVGLTLQVETYFLVDHVVVLGFNRSSGAYLLTISGVVGLICRMGEGFMFIKFNTNSISHLTVAMFVLGCGHLILTLFENYWSILGAMLLYGMGYSVYSAVLSPFTAEVVGIEQFSVGYGVLISVLGLGFAISGVVGGMLYDITGSYTIVFLSATAFTFVVFLIFLVLCLRLKKRRK